MRKLYTQTRAAEVLGISRHGLQDRITSLERRGKPLSAGSGDIVYLGKAFKITEKGLKRLAHFKPLFGKPPAPVLNPVAEQEVRERLRACLKLGVAIDAGFIEAVRREISERPALAEENWEAPPAYVPHQCYHAYTAPRE